MVFVWRFQEVRLLWAFALDRRTKENVLSCLQSVVADLNTLTGGSKPPVTRVHSDQAKEFLSHHVMEWLKEHGIRQTFTSAYDSQANGVAERWINLIKTKAGVLLASKYMHTSFWCYAVAWVAKCYNQKVLGQKPRKNLPEFGQLLLVRTKRNHKMEERYPNGVIVLSVQNNSIQETYTAHVAPATFSDKDRWLLRFQSVVVEGPRSSEIPGSQKKFSFYGILGHNLASRICILETYFGGPRIQKIWLLEMYSGGPRIQMFCILGPNMLLGFAAFALNLTFGQ